MRTTQPPSSIHFIVHVESNIILFSYGWWALQLHLQLHYILRFLSNVQTEFKVHYNYLSDNRITLLRAELKNLTSFRSCCCCFCFLYRGCRLSFDGFVVLKYDKVRYNLIGRQKSLVAWVTTICVHIWFHWILHRIELKVEMKYVQDILINICLAK